MDLKSRYEGRQVLRILECYVLWAIGELAEDQEGILGQMEPKLREVFNQRGDWREIVVTTLNLPQHMPEVIRSLWVKNREIAERHGVTLSGQEFAEMFVDSNFAMYTDSRRGSTANE